MECPATGLHCCKSVCSMWVDDKRCPNYDWLGPYATSKFIKPRHRMKPPIPDVLINTIT